MQSLVQDFPDLEWRYERKCPLNASYKAKVQQWIMVHPLLFRPIYEPRIVNSLYLDTAKLTNYYDSLDGTSNRVKLRVRWYGELYGQVMTPALEFKFRNNHLIGKERFPLPAMTTSKNLSLATMLSLTSNLDIGDRVKNYLRSKQFVLLNRYRREYYLSLDKRFRLTVDSSLTYYQIQPNFLGCATPFNDVDSLVLELKFDNDHFEAADQVFKHFPIRFSKYSKYLTGTKIFYK